MRVAFSAAACVVLFLVVSASAPARADDPAGGLLSWFTSIALPQDVVAAAAAVADEDEDDDNGATRDRDADYGRARVDRDRDRSRARDYDHDYAGGVYRRPPASSSSSKHQSARVPTDATAAMITSGMQFILVVVVLIVLVLFVLVQVMSTARAVAVHLLYAAPVYVLFRLIEVSVMAVWSRLTLRNGIEAAYAAVTRSGAY